MRLTLALLALAAANVHAQVRFDYTATVLSGPDHVGDTVSISIVTSGDPLASKTVNGSFIDDDLTQDVGLFNSVAGTGFTGNWTRPSEFDWSPYTQSQVSIAQSKFVNLLDSDSGPLSLQFFGNTVNMMNFTTYVGSGVLSSYAYAISQSFAQIYITMSGSYAVVEPSYIYISTAGGDYDLTPTALTITPVPESSTYGLALGGLALAFVALRRRTQISKQSE